MLLKKIAGSKFFIGGRMPYKTEAALADFSGQTFVEMDGWQTSGDLGAEQETQTESLINRNATVYAKGGVTFPIMANMFVPMLDDVGQIQFRAAQRSCKPFAFKVEWGADCGEESTVTISMASPGVVTWNAHGLVAGTPVVFTTTGTLPTGLSPGVTYFVAATPAPAANTFSVAATPGGAAIATTAAGTGIITARAQPVGDTDLFIGFAMLGVKGGGGMADNRLVNYPVQPISHSVSI